MPGNQEAFQQAMNLGHSAAWDQHWEQAAGYYRQALEQFPDQPAALSSLGLALFELEHYDEALSFYQRCARVAPTDPIPLEKTARIYSLQGRLSEAVQVGLQAAELQMKGQEVQKAVENWLAVLQMQPENLLARTRLGIVYERTGHKVEAVSQYLAAASIIQHAGDTARALQLAEHALQILPESGDARTAHSLIKAGQLLPPVSRPNPTVAARQTAVLKRPVASGPKSGQDPIAEARQLALTQLAAVLFEQGEESPVPPPQARRDLTTLTRGVSNQPAEGDNRASISLHLGQAIELLTHKKDRPAAVALEQAYTAGLNHTAALFALGMLFTRVDPEKAVQFLRGPARLPDYALASNLLLGQNYFEQHLLRDAALAYLQALRYADLASVPSGQRDELEELYEPLLEMQSEQGSESSWMNICETIPGQLIRPGWREYMQAARQQLPNRQMPLAEMLLEIHSSQVVEILAKVRKLAAQNKLRSATEEAYHALQFAPTYLPLHIQIGDLLLQEGHTQEAVEKFLLVAHLYSLRGETSNAIRLLMRTLQMAPLDTAIRTALIDLLVSDGRVDEAMQQYIDLGDFYYQMSDLNLARQNYLSVLRLPSNSRPNREITARALQKAADIDLQRLDLRAALHLYEQLRSLLPEEPSTRASLIDLHLRLGQDAAALAELDSFISLLENGGQQNRAIEFVTGLLKDRASRLDLRKRLADLYLHTRQTDKAIEQLDLIADGLLVAKNKPSAIKVLETILSLNPPNASDYRLALAQLKSS